MIFKNIKCILFDMDGTVLDSETLFDKAQLLVLKEYGINASNNDLKEFKGLSYKHFYPYFIEKFDINADICDLRKLMRKFLHDAMKCNLSFIDGFEDFYKEFVKRKNLKVALVTNTTRATFKKIQNYINIDDYFSYVITSTDCVNPKPSPEPYIQAMKHLRVEPSQTIIFEDSETGLLSAVKSKAKVVGIATTLDKKKMLDIDSEIISISGYKEFSRIYSDFLINNC